jgi:ferric-dicitrate binding protein FerR (iron transport regulator)
MVGEFNRYNRLPQFRLEGKDVELRHYTGVFDADDPDSLVQLLAAEPGLAVERNGDEIIVSER